ncbi:MAG: hypothetical protein ACRDJM_07270 [Actinomycetota bacterium]
MPARTARRFAATTAAITLLVLAALQLAQAADVPYVTGPGGQFVGYTIPVFALPAGSTMTLVNVDIPQHDVIATTFGPDSNTWCAEQEFEIGRCPVFWSPLIGLGAQAPVYGVEALPAGGIYAFYCSIHSAMDGTLVVLPAV